jgi:hypothetical protein
MEDIPVLEVIRAIRVIQVEAILAEEDMQEDRIKVNLI